MSITKGTFLAGSAMNTRRVRVFRPAHCPFVSTFFFCARAARTGGKLFHGRPPGVVTANVREAMRCGIREASSVRVLIRTKKLATNYPPCAIIPPKLIPTICNSLVPVHPSVSSRQITSSAIPDVLHSPTHISAQRHM